MKSNSCRWISNQNRVVDKILTTIRKPTIFIGNIFEKPGNRPVGDLSAVRCARVAHPGSSPIQSNPLPLSAVGRRLVGGLSAVCRWLVGGSSVARPGSNPTQCIAIQNILPPRLCINRALINVETRPKVLSKVDPYLITAPMRLQPGMLANS